MEIVNLYLIAVFFMFISIGAIGWMMYHSHTRNREIMIQRDQIQELQIRTFEMEKLRSIAAAEEEQMRRIGRFLHDEVGGNLHVLLHVLEKSETRSEKETIEILEKASALTKKSIDSVRNTSQELVPYFLLNFGLTRTLQSMADEINDLPGIGVTYSESIEWSPEQLPQETIIQLYRLIQEVHSNILRHAKPTEIKIHLATTPQAISIELSHNGVGISQSEYIQLLQTGKSQGLKNIDYRATLLQAPVRYIRHENVSIIDVSIDKSNLQLLPTTPLV